MSAPRLNRRLILEEAQLTPDGAGGYVTTWMPLGALWAALQPGAGRETGVQDIRVSQISLTAVVRAAPLGAKSRPRPEQRFREGDRVFLIHAVHERAPDGLYLECKISEEVAT